MDLSRDKDISLLFKLCYKVSNLLLDVFLVAWLLGPYVGRCVYLCCIVITTLNCIYARPDGCDFCFRMEFEGLAQV